MNDTKKSTRDKILDLLKKEVAISVNDITEQLNITHMAVRKHLTILEKDNLILSNEIKQPIGRPLQVYSLTEKGERLFPKNYEGISVDFLHDIKDLHGTESIYYLFKKREERLTKEYSTRIDQKSTNEKKLNELVKIQNEKGYMADISKIGENTYELVEYNCPILEVAKEFKQACNCETQLFKNVLETDKVNRVSCKTDGDNHCKFLFKF